MIIGNSLKDAIRSYLGHGKEYAVTGKSLANILNYSNDRIIRIAIREMIADGIPIASSVNQPYGYYIVSTQQEYNEYIAVLRARALEDFGRLKDFRKASEELFSKGHQMAMSI